MSTGVLSPGWSAIVTGAALLYVAYLLASVSGDAAAPYVAVLLAIAGVWQVGRGSRAEVQRRRSTEDPT
jgi:hypothetical protein